MRFHAPLRAFPPSTVLGPTFMSGWQSEALHIPPFPPRPARLRRAGRGGKADKWSCVRTIPGLKHGPNTAWAERAMNGPGGIVVYSSMTYPEPAAGTAESCGAYSPHIQAQELATRTRTMPHDLIAIITTSDPAFAIGRWMVSAARPTWPPARRGPALDAFRRQSENLYERVRATSFWPPSIAITCPPTAAQRQGPGAVRGLHAAAGPAFRGGDRRFPRGRRTIRPQRRHRQRPGRRLPGPGLSNPGRPGPPQRPLRPRQPVDVSHGPSGRPPAGDPAGAETPRDRRSNPFRSSSNGRRSAWTSRTAAGATSSSWAWIFPRGRGC